MAIVVGVRFRTAGKIYDFSPEGEEYQKGEHVIVETARGIECGEVQNGNHEVADAAVIQPLKPVQRRATAEDVAKNVENRRKEKEAREICLERIRRHKLEMKLIDVEYTFDSSKIMFYFTADGRVDFRDLVKDLASVFRTRIELRQIGVRDEAKMMGAIGTCGRELCCSTFLSEFHPVSIKMAKEQSLSLNPTKISGSCGRLMCCLKYENEAYEYLHKKSPRVDAIVSTPQGQGTVVAVNLLRESVRVRLDSETGNDLLELKVDELEIIKDGGKRHGGDRAMSRRETPARDARAAERTETSSEEPSEDGKAGRDPNRSDRSRDGARVSRDPARNRDRRRGNDRESHAAQPYGQDEQPSSAPVGAEEAEQAERPTDSSLAKTPANSDGPLLVDWNDAVIEEPSDLSE